MKNAAKWILPTILLLVCCGGLIYFSSSGRTVDFSGSVTAIRAEEDSVYVTAIQSGSQFTCEIRLRKTTRCRDLAGNVVDPQTIAVGDMITLNFRGKTTYTDDGLGHAAARGTVEVIPLSRSEK